MKKELTRNPLKERKISNVSGILGNRRKMGPPKSLVDRVKSVEVEVNLDVAKAELKKAVMSFLKR